MVALQALYVFVTAGVADLNSSNEVVWQQRSVIVHRHLQQQAVASAVKLTSLQAGDAATMHCLEAAPLTRLGTACAGSALQRLKTSRPGLLHLTRHGAEVKRTGTKGNCKAGDANNSFGRQLHADPPGRHDKQSSGAVHMPKRGHA